LCQQEYNKRWFIISKNEHYDNLISLALDRIVAIESIPIAYGDSLHIDFDAYFDTITGITKMDLPLKKIVVKVQASQVNYIKTKPWHHSFTIIDSDINDFKFFIKVIPNYELESLILSFGEHIEVLQPATLRNRLQSRTKHLSNAYH
jgi:predicted DNA-binding transcriptional regulator YafY